MRTFMYPVAKLRASRMCHTRTPVLGSQRDHTKKAFSAVNPTAATLNYPSPSPPPPSPLHPPCHKKTACVWSVGLNGLTQSASRNELETRARSITTLQHGVWGKGKHNHITNEMTVTILSHSVVSNHGKVTAVVAAAIIAIIGPRPAPKAKAPGDIRYNQGYPLGGYRNVTLNPEPRTQDRHKGHHPKEKERTVVTGGGQA